MAWKRRLFCEVEVNTFIFLIHNGWTRKSCTVFLVWEVCQVSKVEILKKSWLTAELLVKGSWKSWEEKEHASIWLRTVTESKGQNKQLLRLRSSKQQEVSCSLLHRASDHIANRVPGYYTSLKNNSRWLCQIFGFLCAWTTNLWVVNSPGRRKALCQHTDSCRKRTGW